MIFQGIFNRIKGAFSKTRESASSVVGRGFSDMFSGYGSGFTVSYERKAVHADMQRMDEDDEIVTFALDAIASRALGYEDPSIDGFTVTVRAEDGEDIDATEAQRIINRLVKRCKLRKDGWQIIRKMVKFGNEFREILIDEEAREVVGLKPLPEHTISPVMDKQGNRLPGYIQRPENMPEVKAIEFKEWEIVHFPFGEEDGYLGTPLMKSARKNWKRLNMALDMTAMARLIRAFAKWVHKVPVNTEWSPEQQKQAIDRYKDAMSKRNLFDQDTQSLLTEQNPQTVATDFYITDDGSKRGGVEMLDPENAQLQNIKDIEHFTNRLIAGTRVPKRYFPFEGSTPKLSEGGGSAEDKHFACLLMMCQMLLKDGYSKVFDIELMLHGLNPAQYRYEWRMAEISTTDQYRVAQSQLTLAKTMDLWLGKYPELRKSLDSMIREFSKMSEDTKQALAKVDISEDIPPASTAAPRVQLPGAGAGEEAREKA